MPQVINRLHIILIDKKAEKLLASENITAEYFLQKFDIIEKELLGKLNNIPEAAEIERIEKQLAYLLDQAVNLCREYDKNLENTSFGAKAEILKTYGKLNQKLNTSIKRHNETIFAKYKHVSNYIFPNSALQERVLSPVNVLCEIGIDGFKKLLLNTSELNRGELNILKIWEERAEKLNYDKQ